MTEVAEKVLPAYKRIQQSVMRRIETGELKPFDAVESERVLAGMHSVSMMTARHALAELERSGAIERRPRSGSYVAPPKIEFNRLMSFTEEMAARSVVASSRLLSLRTTEKEPEVAARLLLEPDSRLIRIERLRMGGGQPFAIEICYLPAERFGKLSRAQLDRDSLYALLDRSYGVTLSYADEEVDAITPTPELARVLTMKGTQPLLRIRQVVYSTEGEPTVYGICLNRADRHSLRIRRVR